jgi:hypothetical protein
MLSMRGFIPICIIIQPKYALYFKEKNYGLSLLNSQMDEEMESISRR